MQEVKFQKLRTEGMTVITAAQERFQAGQTDKAMDMLKEHIRTVEASGFEPDKIALLKKQPESRLATFVMLKNNTDFTTAQNSDHKAYMDKKSREFLAEETKKKQIADLMNQYHTLYKEHKYQEAELCAIKAQELDPDNYVVGAAVQTAHMAKAHAEYSQISHDKEEMFRRGLNDAEKPGPAVNLDNPLAVDAKLTARNFGRGKSDTVINLNGGRSEREREIYRRLDSQVTGFDYRDTPLQQVLDDLAGWSNINIVPDVPALKDANISMAQAITMKLEGASLKSALNLLLHQAHLTYQVANDALIITTEENAHGKQERRVFPVLDLVIPVMNYTQGGAAAALQQAIGGQGSDSSNLKINGQTTPWLGQSSMSTGTPVGNGMMANGQNQTMTSMPAQAKAPSDTIEDVLIKLIQNTIEPQSWSAVGGPGTIEFYPLGKALAVNQTPDIQEQVQELLNALRRLQDQEVAVEGEVHHMIAESFYERIGLDFNINITSNNSKYSQQINSQQFAPFGFLNNVQPEEPGKRPGRLQATCTQDLGVPIGTPPASAMPSLPFGTVPEHSRRQRRRIDLGIAFLSDIQVFLFMEAAQGDTRTNVMQAPKLTLFNGQTSTITIHDLQFFVTSVQVLQIGGQVVFVPTNTPVPTGGVTMTIQCGDLRRPCYVRLSLTPNLTNLASANITLFPITTFITPVFEGWCGWPAGAVHAVLAAADVQLDLRQYDGG